MTFKTLSQINRMLEANVKEQQSFYEKARRNLLAFEEAHNISWNSREKLTRVPEDLKEEYSALIATYNKYTVSSGEAKDAMDDFNSHDWH